MRSHLVRSLLAPRGAARIARHRRAFSTTLSSRSWRDAVDVSGRDTRVCAVLGGQWGDEGKGKLADVLAKGYDIVARFNGGANAGHTVVVGDQKFAFHLLPCGLVYPHTQNILGNGVVVHMPALFEELAPLDDAGIEWRGRLKISDRAHMLFDFHQAVDGMQEERRADANIGTTKKGIGPAYSSKATRNGVRFGQLLHWDSFKDSLTAAADAHTRQYGVEIDVTAELERYRGYRDTLVEGNMIIDSVQVVNQAYNDGKRIITEGANAAMLDLDFGTYPFVTSSSTTVGGICTGLGLSPDKVECPLGVIKAYTTRVGWGPFPTELTDDLSGGMLPRGAPGTEIGEHMQRVGAEFGVTTGRKRRCGWFDAVVAQYGHMINNYRSVNITKLDVLDDLEEVKIGVAYKLNGQRLPRGAMPATLEDLGRVEVEYETMPGWKTDISGARTFEELPGNAQAYINRIEELVGCPVSWIGVGVGRDDMATKGFTV